MQCNLYATFRLLAGGKTYYFDLPGGATVRHAVDAMIKERPVLRQHWLDDQGEIYAHVHIFVNGQDVNNLPAGADTPLNAEDVLDFFPPVGGGSL